MNKFNPNSYKDLKSDYEMIQSAVDAASKEKATVVIPRYNERTKSDVWEIDHAIKLYTGSVICLDNCHIKQADSSFENIFKNSNNETDLGYTRNGRQSDIRIYGLGNAILDGGNHNGLTEQNSMKDGNPPVDHNSVFNFLNAERITVENIRIINHRYWGFVHHYCSNVRISNIDFYISERKENQDGIDLRTGCSHFIIENITGLTGDDTVALTCLRSRHDELIKNAGLDDSIHNVIIRNVNARTKYSLVRLLNHYGKKIYNILAENIMEQTEAEYSEDAEYEPLHKEVHSWRTGACVRIGSNEYCRDGNFAKVGDTYNVTVKNVLSQGRMGVKIDRALSDALIENIRMYSKGGTALYFGEGEVENIIVRDIIYPNNHTPTDTDDNRREGPWNNEGDRAVVTSDRELCGIYFKETKAKNVFIQNVISSDKLTAVVGGSGEGNVKIRNLVKISETTPTFDVSGIVVDLKND